MIYPDRISLENALLKNPKDKNSKLSAEQALAEYDDLINALRSLDTSSDSLKESDIVKSLEELEIISLDDAHLILNKIAAIVEGKSDISSKNLSKGFVHGILKQDFVITEKYTEALPVFEPSQFVEFMSLYDKLLSLCPIEESTPAEIVLGMHTYTSKYNHSSAKLTGSGSKPVINNLQEGGLFNTATIPGDNVYTGTCNGGALKPNSEYIPIFSYVLRFRTAEGLITQMALFDIIRNRLHTSPHLNLPFLDMFSDASELERNSVAIKSTLKLRIITLNDKPMIVVPSNLMMEQIKVLSEAVTNELNQQGALLSTELINRYENLGKKLLTDTLKYIRNVSTPISNVKYVKIVAQKEQNVSKLYQDLFMRGIPRFKATIGPTSQTLDEKAGYREYAHSHTKLRTRLDELISTALKNSALVTAYRDFAHLMRNSDKQNVSAKLEVSLSKKIYKEIVETIDSLLVHREYFSTEVKKGKREPSSTVTMVITGASSTEDIRTYVKNLIGASLNKTTLSSVQIDNIIETVTSQLADTLTKE